MKTQIFDLKTEYDGGMEAAARAIREGKLAVFPTETVYGLGADAMNEKAVREIFTVKGRPQDNPLIVHICDFDQVYELASVVTPLAEILMRRFWPGPLTLILPAKPNIPSAVTAGLKTVGIRMPQSAYARELIRRSGRFIAAPSANISGKPSPTRVKHVVDDFDGKVPVILNGGEAAVGVESTVCDVTGEKAVILRPGGITAEMIREATGDVEIAHAVLNGIAEGEKAASPGMKYKHYAPKAKVLIVEGEDRKVVASSMAELYKKYTDQGKATVIFCKSPVLNELGGCRVLCIGKTEEEVARNLFDGLRSADDDGEDVVLFEAVTTAGMGLAVMNRVIRAAGFQVIHAE